MENMQNRITLLIISLFFITLTSAQDKDKVLLTIDGSPVYVSEFKKVYLKNIDLVKDESQKDIDEYLNLFINYKLKLQEAKALNLDKEEKYLTELEGYRKQLSAGYLTDNQASDALVKEAYDRLQERVNASHILIQVPQNASPQDTLAAFQKITEIRNKIVEGADFNEQARAYSEDPSAKNNGGDLGWFSAFRMVYPFEDAAFTTEVGQVSEPFKTRFGYHILKVNAKEKTLGEVEVAHIMVAFKQDVIEEDAKQKILEIEEQLQQDVSFESLAKEYSDDRNTAVNGGKMKRFGQGALNAENFEKAAFALQSPGQISEPVKTKYGWHLIKLIKKHESRSFEEMKQELTDRIKRDSRSQLISDSFIASLKEKYNVSHNKEAVSYFKNSISDTVMIKDWKIPTDDPAMQNTLFQLTDKKITYLDFAEFIKENGANQPAGISSYIKPMYKAFESQTLLKYYEENLENDNEEFAGIISEYRDGLLLFDLMETKIWNAAKEDSLGIKNFYDERKKEYIQDETYKVVKASSVNEKAIENIKSQLESGKKIEDIKKELVEKGDKTVIFSDQELVKNVDDITKRFEGTQGQIVVTNDNNYYTLIRVEEIMPARIKTFEETKGKVINDYQDVLESTWMEELRNKYPIKVNKKALKSIKKELTL